MGCGTVVPCMGYGILLLLLVFSNSIQWANAAEVKCPNGWIKLETEGHGLRKYRRNPGGSPEEQTNDAYLMDSRNQNCFIFISFHKQALKYYIVDVKYNLQDTVEHLKEAIKLDFSADHVIIKLRGQLWQMLSISDHIRSYMQTHKLKPQHNALANEMLKQIDSFESEGLLVPPGFMKFDIGYLAIAKQPQAQPPPTTQKVNVSLIARNLSTSTTKAASEEDLCDCQNEECESARAAAIAECFEMTQPPTIAPAFATEFAIPWYVFVIFIALFFLAITPYFVVMKRRYDNVKRSLTATRDELLESSWNIDNETFKMRTLVKDSLINHKKALVELDSRGNLVYFRSKVCKAQEITIDAYNSLGGTPIAELGLPIAGKAEEPNGAGSDATNNSAIANPNTTITSTTFGQSSTVRGGTSRQSTYRDKGSQDQSTIGATDTTGQNTTQDADSEIRRAFGE